MKELMQDFVSSGMLTGVVIGVVTSLAAAYLKDPIDCALGKVSNKWRTRNAAKSSEREELISALVNNPSEQVFAAIKASHLFLSGAYYTIFGLLIMLCQLATLQYGLPKYAAVFLALFSLLSLIMGSLFVLNSISHFKDISEARKRQPGTRVFTI
jgi:hypothetical protein